jgi:hypothetical protein
MKTKLTTSTLTLFVLFYSIQSFAQDTIIIAKNFKYKFGVKLISEKSGDYQYDDFINVDNHVFCFGFQVIRKIKETKSSFESGLYFITKVKLYEAQYTNQHPPFLPEYLDFTLPIYHHYLNIPVNFRVDTKTIYFAAGIFGDIPLYYNARGYYKEYADSLVNYGTDRNFYLGWNMNLGMEKTISKKLDMFIEARLAVTVSSFKKEDGGFFMTTGNIGSSNVNYGFSVGANYKLERKLK